MQRENYLESPMNYIPVDARRLKGFNAQKMKFSAKDFFITCHQIQCFLRIWSRLLKKSLGENLTFCAVFKMT